MNFSFEINFIERGIFLPMTDSYQRIEKIGEGTYGIVYKAINRKTNSIVALKKIRLENEDEGIPATTIREISLLKTLKHPTIINLIDVIYSEKKLYLVFEYLETDLRSFIDTQEDIPEALVLRMALQLFTALCFCHTRGILHRDVKPQNILVDKDLNIKLADFGLGRAINVPLRTYTHDIVTLWYRPPEILLGSKYYSGSVDVWSAGCIIAELILSKPLFPGDSEIDQLYKIFRVRGTPDDEVWLNVSHLPNYKAMFPKWKGVRLMEILNASEELVDVIEKCMVYDPVKRMVARDLMKHEAFKDIDK